MSSFESQLVYWSRNTQVKPVDVSYLTIKNISHSLEQRPIFAVQCHAASARAGRSSHGPGQHRSHPLQPLSACSARNNAPIWAAHCKTAPAAFRSGRERFPRESRSRLATRPGAATRAGRRCRAHGGDRVTATAPPPANRPPRRRLIALLGGGLMVERLAADCPISGRTGR